MRLLKLTLRGVTRFSGRVSIDFEALGPGLIALQGQNGAGKSTLLEAPAVALFKQFPSRPGFYENFTGRDAFIEATFDGGTVRLAVDAVKRITEAYVIVDGNPVTDGKAASFQAAVAERFGSFELFLASVFACQSKKGSFLGLVKSERKDLFVELLGLGALQMLSESARGKAAQAQATLDHARAKLAELQRQADDLADAPARLADAQTAVDAAAHRLEATRTEEVSALGALERARTQAASVADLIAAEDAARRAAITAAKAVDDAEDRITKAEKRRDERLRFLDARGVEKLEPAARARHADALARIAIERGSVTARIEGLPDLAEATARKEAAEQGRKAADAKLAEVSAADQAVRDAIRTEAEAQREVDRGLAAFKAERDRLLQQADRLMQVPCTKAEEWSAVVGPVVDLAGTCPLLADARAAQDRLDHLVPVDASPYAAAQAAVETAKRAREALGVEFVDPGSFARAYADAVGQIAEAKAGDSLRERLAALGGTQIMADKALDIELAEAVDAVAQSQAERLGITTEYESELMQADSAVTTAKENRAQATATHAAASAAAKAAQTVDLTAVERSLSQAKKDRESAEFAMRTADQAHAAAAAKAARLSELQPEIEAATDRVTQAEQATGDWNLLEKSLGRDGVQALEIDAAGPEVARITNELLTACYGPRFSMTLETLAEKRDGGTKEVFDVRVFDGGAERPVEALSGGEKVVVGEALGLALAIFTARKSDVRWQTLFRDETAGALDPVNAVAYVQMLRRARELAGAHQIVFIAHQPEVWEAADAVVHIADGVAYVQGETRAA